MSTDPEFPPWGIYHMHWNAHEMMYIKSFQMQDFCKNRELQLLKCSRPWLNKSDKSIKGIQE